jgi:hypothetical protein
MESKIGELVEQRSGAQFAISRANQQFQVAQSVLQGAKEEFQRLEQEIQYRMGLINQMRGGTPAQMPPVGVGYFPTADAPAAWMALSPTSPAYHPAQPYPSYPPPYDPRMVGQPDEYGRASVPANNHGLYPDVAAGPDGARTGSAEELRRDELRTRGY